MDDPVKLDYATPSVGPKANQQPWLGSLLFFCWSPFL